MTGVVVATAFLLLASALLALPPLLARDTRVAPASGTDRRRAALESRREELYLALHEAELDFRTGKLTEVDHDTLRQHLLSEAADAIRELDELGGAAGTATGEPPDYGDPPSSRP